MLATVQLSVVIDVPIDTAVAVQPTFVFAVTFAGHVITGLTLSVTVTVCAQVAVLPDPSVAVQITVVTPFG